MVANSLKKGQVFLFGAEDCTRFKNLFVEEVRRVRSSSKELRTRGTEGKAFDVGWTGNRSQGAPTD